MQETRNLVTSELRREILSAASRPALLAAMDADQLPK
jgi:hypothetical protein